jgi:hypothetical protein
MSNYGPPGGQYPGQPSDPWQQNDPYGQPSSGAPYPTSPYGTPDPWSSPPASSPSTPGPYGQPASGGYDNGYQQDPYGQPGYGQPQQPSYPQQPNYGQQPAYGPPQQDPYGAPQPDPYGPPQPVWGAPAPPPKKRHTGGIIALVVVLVLLLCGGGVTALYFIGKSSNKPLAQSSASVNPTPSTVDDSPSPTPDDSSDAADPITSVTEGDCVLNKGTDADADLQIVTCKKGTFLVVARFDGTTDHSKCDAIKASTHWFTYTTTPATDDFVLCLKEQ